MTWSQAAIDAYPLDGSDPDAVFSHRAAFDAGHREGQRWAARVHDMAESGCEYFEPEPIRNSSTGSEL